MKVVKSAWDEVMGQEEEARGNAEVSSGTARSSQAEQQHLHGYVRTIVQERANAKTSVSFFDLANSTLLCGCPPCVLPLLALRLLRCHRVQLHRSLSNAPPSASKYSLHPLPMPRRVDAAGRAASCHFPRPTERRKASEQMREVG